MALPPRLASVLVEMSDPDGATFGYLARPAGHTLDDSIGTPIGTWAPPSQQETAAYKHLFKNYPDEVIVPVHQDMFYALFGIRIQLVGFEDNISIDTTYPDPLSIISEYDPTPPPGPNEAPPNPNGGSKNEVYERSSGFTPLFYPRWHTDPAYELYNYEQWLGSICPQKDYEYLIEPGGFNFEGPYSADLTVDNLDSRVLNEETDEYEFYPYEQATFDYKQTTTLRIPKTWTTCCWNEGAVINGEVRFQSVDITAEARGQSGGDYGFGGMTAKTGFVASDDGSQSFSITISDSYIPIEIVIPASPGKITFVNDFVITSVTKPS
jgi:hypothetical protein